MNTLTLELPDPVYRELAKQPLQTRQTVVQLAIKAIADYLNREAKLAAGRKMLLLLPEEAHQYNDTPPSDLAARHDDYLYGEG